MGRPTNGYINAAGDQIPGVTTVCGMLDKPALVGWAGKLCVAAGYEAGRNGEAPPRWNQVCYGKRDKAAEAGTITHDLFEQHLRGETPEQHKNEGAWRGYLNAVHWLESSGMKIEPFERPLVSERYQYGGTPDALAHGREVCLADWKTGGIYPEHAIQMGAYRQLLRENGIDAPGGVHLVRFSRDHGDFTHHYFAPDALDLGWEVFLGLMEARRPLMKLKDRIK